MVVSSIIDELTSLIESGGIQGALLRGGITGGAALGVGDLIKYLQSVFAGGSARDKAAAHKVPRFALVDLKKDTILVFMGPRRAYRILLRPRRRAQRTKIVKEVIRER